MNRFIGWLRKAWMVLVVAGIVVGLDQWTKMLIRQQVAEYTAIIPIPALGEYFMFERVRNYGAAFGILQNQSNLFVVIAIVVAIGILVYIRYLPTEQRLVRLLLGLQLGGALGNLTDRINEGFVTDFVKVGVPGIYYWPNFNIADSSIVVGVIGLGIFILLDDFRRQREEKIAKEHAVATPASGPRAD